MSPGPQITLASQMSPAQITSASQMSPVSHITMTNQMSPASGITIASQMSPASQMTYASQMSPASTANMSPRMSQPVPTTEYSGFVQQSATQQHVVPLAHGTAATTKASGPPIQFHGKYNIEWILILNGPFSKVQILRQVQPAALDSCQVQPV